MTWVTPSPLSITVPVNVRSPTCLEVQDAAKARTALDKKKYDRQENKNKHKELIEKNISLEYFNFKCTVDSWTPGLGEQQIPGLGAVIPPTKAAENPSITSDSPKAELPIVYCWPEAVSIT